MTEYYYSPTADRAVAHVTSLSDSSDFDVLAADFQTAKIDIETYTVGAACDIKHIIASDGDFSTPDSTITLDSFGGNGISEGNATPLLRNRLGLRITNTSGSAADFAVIGEVVEDE